MDRHNRGMWFRRTGNLPGQTTSNSTHAATGSSQDIKANSSSTDVSPPSENSSASPSTATHQPHHQTTSLPTPGTTGFPPPLSHPQQPQNGASFGALHNAPHNTHILPPPNPTDMSNAGPSYLQQPPPQVAPPPPQPHQLGHAPPPPPPQPSLPLPYANSNSNMTASSPNIPPLYSGNLFQDSDLGWLFENVDQNFDSGMSQPSVDDHGDGAPPITPEYATSPESPDDDTIWHTVVQKLLKCLFDKKPDSASSSPLDACTLSNTYSAELINSWISDAGLLKKYFMCYFDAYHDHFPIVHKPTFLRRPDKIHPLLVISIATLGTAFAPHDHFAISVKIHERLRWLVFSYNELVNPPLWMFQALILIEAFEKMLSTRSHHELAAMFHGSMVILMRRHQPFSFDIDDDDSSDESLLNGSKANHNTSNGGKRTSKYSLEAKWHRWIENESLRRVFFLAFVIDSQHVALFGHSQCMSANEILFELPCAEELWEAPDAQSWISRYEATQRPPLFLDAIKSLLMLKPLDATTSQFSRLIILHGLYSIAVQMQNQKSATIGFVSGRPNDACKHCGKAQHQGEQWRALLSQAIQTWSFSLFTQSSLIIEACQALHQMAYVTLYLSHATVLDIMVFGRYPSLVGRRLTRRDYAKAERHVKAWANSPEAIISVRHALLLIQETLFPKRLKYGYSDDTVYESNKDKIALRPWCLFVCALVVYAFHCSHNRDQARLPANCATHADALSMADRYLSNRLRALSSPYPVDVYTSMDKTEQENITCMLKAVQTALYNCRWEMLEHSYQCLGALIYTQPA